MKNKKLLTRIFALLASLVLVGALAVPCFADAQTSDQDYVINSITFTDGNSAYQWLTENYDRVQKVFLYQGGELYGASSNLVSFTNSSDIHMFNVSVSIFSDFVVEGSSSSLSSVVVLFNLTSENTQLANTSIDFVNGQAVMLSGQPSITFSNTYWSSAGITMTCEYVTEYVPKDNNTRSGMFGQLYNILRDAIFGKDVALDDSQDFVLTQISTWMTYIVILLPLLVVGIILYRVFVR